MRSTIALLALLALWMAAGNLTGAQKDSKPLAEIRGRVVNTQGEPVAGALVVAFRLAVVNGFRENLPARSASTDEQGQYRIPQLNPGRYSVKLAAFQEHGAGDQPVAAAGLTFEPLYFPDARTAESAGIITLSSGVEARADFSVALKPGHTIRGHIGNLVRSSPVVLQLLSFGEDLALNRSSVNSEDGRFVIHEVPDGSYRLRAVQLQSPENMFSAERVLDIAGKDMDGVELALAPGQALTGFLRVNRAEGTPATQAAIDVRFTMADGLRRACGECTFHSRQVSAIEFLTAPLVPGKYRVSIETLGPGYVKAAKAGDTDLLAQPQFTLGPGTRPLLEIEIGADGGAVNGSIAPGARGSSEIKVLLVAEALDRPPLVETADDDGSFVFYDLAPGVYRMHAWRESAEVEYGAPEVMRKLVGSGERVEVKADEEIALEVQSLSQMPR